MWTGSTSTEVLSNEGFYSIHGSAFQLDIIAVMHGHHAHRWGLQTAVLSQRLKVRTLLKRQK
jgi:hypothetical protein